MKITEAIILAGGLGTRLRSAVPNLPKCMAPVNNIPFLSFVIAYLQKEGITKFIFSLGYKSEIIIDYLESHHSLLHKSYVIEKEPLGTGGAIKLACSKASEENILVVNGDTIFNVDISAFATFHFQMKSHCSIALKEMKNFSRYGTIDINEDGSVKTFREKQYCEKGHINGGIYLLGVKQFADAGLPAFFSFEQDYLEKNTGRFRFFGLLQEGYFIDIGIPEDYQNFKEDYQLSIHKNNSGEKKGWNKFAAFINAIANFLHN